MGEFVEPSYLAAVFVFHCGFPILKTMAGAMIDMAVIVIAIVVVVLQFHIAKLVDILYKIGRFCLIYNLVKVTKDRHYLNGNYALFSNICFSFC